MGVVIRPTSETDPAGIRFIQLTPITQNQCIWDLRNRLLARYA